MALLTLSSKQKKLINRSLAICATGLVLSLTLVSVLG